jgi:hypothetical protein
MTYSEIGFGNDTFISTEFEVGVKEWREKGWKIKKVSSLYLRVWIGKIQVILDSREGLKLSKKSKVEVKILFGAKGK